MATPADITPANVKRPNSECGVCATASVLCNKWTAIVIRDLAESSARFCELERSLGGISPRTLSLRLRELEEHEIVERKTFAEVPPRVEYALTEKGRAMVPIINAMRSYGEQWLGDICGCEADEPAGTATKSSTSVRGKAARGKVASAA
ncbi:MAG: helix-turn-helix domain-containing protein [Solirubrobacterales bacterium]